MENACVGETTSQLQPPRQAGLQYLVQCFPTMLQIYPSQQRLQFRLYLTYTCTPLKTHCPSLIHVPLPFSFQTSRSHTDGPHPLGRRRSCLPDAHTDGQSPMGTVPRTHLLRHAHVPSRSQVRAENVSPKTKKRPVFSPPQCCRAGYLRAWVGDCRTQPRRA